ncbi:MAG: hypothetical protein HQL14_06895 [Candidatus Omnitrophica bacterium]|nr:hypothetical protein [Candidatus Omnitrophota bacterium]
MVQSRGLKKNDLIVLMGHESCERLLPLPGRIAVERQKIPHCRISLLTPPVTEYGLACVRKLASLLNSKDEIIVNDLGVLAMLNRDFSIHLIIGRLLARTLFPFSNDINHDKGLLKDLPFILGPKTVGIEVDAVNVDWVPAFISKKIKIRHCDRPLIFAVSRSCIFNSSKQSRDRFVPCRKECLNKKVVALSTSIAKKFLIKENTVIGS